MELALNPDPRLTRKILSAKLLRQPVVVADVGVRGGEHARWTPFGEQVLVHGFDASEEAIAELRQRQDARRHYHCVALADADGTRVFHFRRDSPPGSTFVPPPADRYSTAAPDFQQRTLAVRALDSLIAEGAVPPPDVLKVDVEGFESRVFKGAVRCLGGVLAVEFETGFNASAHFPETHFGSVQPILLEHGFRLFDVAFDRQACASFVEAGRRAGRPPDTGTGRPTTFNMLFSREWQDGATPRPEQLLKQMMVLESYGLVDVAYDLAVRFADSLPAGLTLDEVGELLLAGARSMPRSPAVLLQKLTAIKASASWRATAPLRALAAVIRHAAGSRPGPIH